MSLLYRNFEECSILSIDPFWKDVFHNCAIGRPPKGSGYDSKTYNITIRKVSQTGKTTKESFRMPTDNPESLLEEAKRVFKEELGIYSPLDLRVKNGEVEELQKIYKESINCEWKKLKPRSVKDTLIASYAIKFKHEHNLTVKEAKDVLDCINLGFQYKRLLPDDVEYADAKIINIKYLEFDPAKKKCVFTRPYNYHPKKEKKAPSQKFNQALTNYIKEKNKT